MYIYIYILLTVVFLISLVKVVLFIYSYCTVGRREL